jgi:trehalose-6-phosphatase
MEEKPVIASTMETENAVNAVIHRYNQTYRRILAFDFDGTLAENGRVPRNYKTR